VQVSWEGRPEVIMPPLLLLAESALRRGSGSGGCGTLGCFVVVLAIGSILYLVLRGRQDRPEALGTAKRAMGSGPVAGHLFPCPYPKCPACAASGEKMKQQWDGLRKVTWTCGYCGSLAGVQELKDEELPPEARRRLGLDSAPGPDFPAQGGGSVDGLLTGMMIGGMMGGSHGPLDGPWGDDGPGDAPDGDGSDFPGDDPGGDDGGGDW